MAHFLEHRLAEAQKDLRLKQDVLSKAEADFRKYKDWVDRGPYNLVEALTLNLREHNALRNSNITDMRQLLAMSPRQLLRIPNLGKKSVFLIEVELLTHDLELWPDREWSVKEQTWLNHLPWELEN